MKKEIDVKKLLGILKSDTDKLGSYTGEPDSPDPYPVQDVDDL